MTNPKPQVAQSVFEFRVQNLHLCMPLTEVSRTLQMVALQALPLAPDYLIGLLNYHGKSVPVFDLAIRLGLQRHEPYNLDTPIVICNHPQGLRGAIVDEVIGVTERYSDQIQQTELVGEAGTPLQGTFTDHNEIILLADMQRLLEIDAAVPLPATKNPES